MTYPYCFEALDRTLQDLMSETSISDKIFGGKVVVFGEIKEFSKWLLKVGEGRISEPNADIKIPKEMLITDIDDPIKGIVDREQREYFSANSVDRSEMHTNILQVFTPELLSSLWTSGLPNHSVKLKVGTPIMLMRNMEQSEGLCNGTRLIVTKMAEQVIEAKVIGGPKHGNVVYIPRLDISPSQSP
ncbi:unnamed protein product [Trifolium pratense]|uniref:Uncharacterized protein n=1 Tax=Trifolium pratense TaxID=57577 RepID=A0ACB0KAY0_TRIPR|nr:unnamed protein product [Trifolium pratense]